ncbi:metallophosphoesterase family protein [Flindersiella endophytica]
MSYELRGRSGTGTPKLVAISDLHVRYAENRALVEELRPESSADWLIVAGDVADLVSDFTWTMGVLRSRFARVIWAPGNHDLWTLPVDPVQSRGEEKYLHLVELCRQLGVDTPEDPYPVWTMGSGSFAIAPLFVLYDYTFRPEGTSNKAEALAVAKEAHVVGNDEIYLHPDPYPSLDAWCAARLKVTTERLDSIPPSQQTILVNHFPLTREPTRILRYPEFALWCGTEATADWHLRYRAEAVVYGHLHIPRTITEDGVLFEEVSLGYPREWQPRSRVPGLPVQVLPAE